MRRLVCSALAAAVAWSGSAWAQGLEEVVVTARKVEESLQDVPIAVSAFTGEDLEARGFTTVADVAQVTPGLELDPTAAISGSSAAITAFIRGIGVSDFLLTIDPGVGLYVDNVYVARSVGGLVDLLDVERVEVLKGPQGTLFGRNTIGGAISVVSKDPGDEFAGSLSVTGGTASRLDVRGKLEVPLAERLYSSLSVALRTQDGYGERLPFPDDYVPREVPAGTAPDAFDNGVLYGNDDPLGEINSLAGRLKLFYDGERVQARLAVDATRTRETAPASTLLGFAPTFGTGAALADAHNAAVLGELAPGVFPPSGSLLYDERWITGDPHTTFGSAPSQSDYDLFGVSLTIDTSFGAVDFKSITSYRDLESDFGRDGDSSPIVLDHTRNQYQHEQFTQEFQLSGLAVADRLQWLVGLYYFQEDGLDRVQVPLGLETDLALTGAPGTVINLWLDEINDVSNTSVAAFAQTTFDLTEKLSVTAGVRYTEDEKTYRPDHRTQGAAPVVLLLDDVTVDFTDVSPRFSVDYRWNDALFTYASFSQGFKSGGFTGRTVDVQDAARPFEPEEAQTVEIGAKLDFDRVRINAAVFATDYTNLQLINQEGITPITVNAGESEIDGIEVEIFAAPTDQLSFQFGYSYLDARYLEITDPNATIDETFAFQNTPESAFNVSADYRIPLNRGGELALRADYTWKDDHFNDAENTPLLAQEAFGLLNLAATYRTADHWRFTAGVQNLTDELFLFSGFSQPGVGFIEGSFNRGRQWYVSSEYTF
ncbi:MAG: TonB-dependent receptor [Pseudomonadota bacterium]